MFMYIHVYSTHLILHQRYFPMYVLVVIQIYFRDDNIQEIEEIYYYT